MTNIKYLVINSNMAYGGIEKKFCPYYRVGFCYRDRTSIICTERNIIPSNGKLEEIPCKIKPDPLGEIRFTSSLPFRGEL